MAIVQGVVQSLKPSQHTYPYIHLFLNVPLTSGTLRHGKILVFSFWLSTYASKAEERSLPIGGSTVSQLQSQEQAGLLDAIDQLRRENIDAEIGIPQIVVCGDQSSGKSSLLEAIAQVPFPAGSGAVTMCKRRA